MTYRRFLGVQPDAPNRKEVEKFIADAEEEVARGKAAVPPTGPLAPANSPPPPPTVPAPPAPATVTPPPPQSAGAPAAPSAAPVEGAPIYQRRWLWTAVAAVVAVGAGVGLALAFTLRDDARVPSSDLGSMTLTFH
ncbi:MAG: hypothetical protein EXR72_02125 [Myxococcales bacterium]|nr:hypothetical protein [Myxococcales bacterium]